jgi:drug/metabolite transporter (DMT)-like permease
MLGVGGILLLSTESLIARGADASAWDVAFWSGTWAASAIVVFFVFSLLFPVSFPLFVTAAAPRRRPASSIPPGPLVASALLQTVSGIGFIVGVKETAVANVVAITASAPAFAAVIAWLALGERTTRRVVLSVGAAMIGIVLVVGGSLRSGGAAGEAATLAAVLAFGVNVSIWRRHPELSRTAVMGLAGAFTAAVCAAPADVVGLDAETMIMLAVLGALVGPVARVSLASATRHLSAVEVGLFTPLETVSATFGAWLLFDETPPGLTWLGGAVVLAAVTVGLSKPRSS